MASSKGKVSKNSRSSKKVIISYEKRIKPKKEYIFIEQTTNNVDKIITVNKEGDIKSYYEGKPVVSVVEKYGKKYYKVLNEVEQEISSI